MRLFTKPREDSELRWLRCWFLVVNNKNKLSHLRIVGLHQLGILTSNSKKQFLPELRHFWLELSELRSATFWGPNVTRSFLIQTRWTLHILNRLCNLFLNMSVYFVNPWHFWWRFWKLISEVKDINQLPNSPNFSRFKRNFPIFF